MNQTKLPGLNVQAPWSRLLLERKKTIETRTYEIPQKYLRQDFWLIETPGTEGNFKARIIGTIRFSGWKEYFSAEEFYSDSDAHLITENNLLFRWRADSKKYGWIVEHVSSVPEFDAPHPRGIIYASPFDSSLRF